MKEKLSKAWNGFRAAVSTPGAIKAEKSLGVIVVVRVLLAVGASDALVRLAEQLIRGA